MSSRPKINQPTDGSCGYIAYYNGKQAEVWANGLFSAKNLAADHFKVPTHKRHLVTVILAEVDNEPVAHTPDF